MAGNDNPVQGLRLLLVDDDEDCREFIAVALEAEGLLVTQVQDAEEAIVKLGEHSFDAVATDKNLPNMDGIGLIQHIRETHGGLPVILITGYGSIGSAVDALKLGAQDYLTKPIEDIAYLVQTIWRAVEHHRLSLENQALQEKLIHAQRMEALGVLAGGVAHELNNTLEPVIGLPSLISAQVSDMWLANGDALAAEKRKDETSLNEIREELQVMEESGRRAAAVVKDLLTLSESGQYRKDTEALNGIVEAALASTELTGMLARRTGISLRKELGKGIPSIDGSASHLERVIVSLVRNAIQALDRRGQCDEPFRHDLIVRTSMVTLEERRVGYEVIEPGEYALAEVSDTGIGISARNIDHIFEPFFTVREKSTTTGTGLGLSIVYRVVKDHRGYVDVRSQEGQGTTFSLYIPVNDRTVSDARTDVPVAGKGQRVLVVDDEASARYVASFLLDKLGYQATTVADGHDAIELLREQRARHDVSPFDIVMLDMVMEEGFDGLTTFEELEKVFPGQKVIVASGYAPTGRVKGLLEKGAVWLNKPYGIEELSAALTEVSR